MDLSKKDGGLPPDSVVQTVDEILRDCQRAVETYHDPSRFSMRMVALAPCSPFSVSEELLRSPQFWPEIWACGLHTHLCETKDEERFVRERCGMRPLEYMESLGWIARTSGTPMASILTGRSCAVWRRPVPALPIVPSPT